MRQKENWQKSRGIELVNQTTYLGAWESGFQEQRWHFVLCECEALLEHWVFHTQDDGGHDFEFFWHEVTKDISSRAHPVFQRAIEQVRELIRLGAMK